MKRKGSILIIVLWALFILGALAVAMSGYVSAQINLSKKLSERARDYYLAKAGVERAILEVKNDITDEYDALTDSWGANDAAFKDAKLGDGSYSVFPASYAAGAKVVRYGLSDEESKINVNKAPKDVLKNIFQIQAGLAEDEAREIAASIINWRLPEDQADKEGANAFHYQTLDRPYEAKNEPIEVLEELLLIKG
ncbi:MAG: type II secretion system protein GspK, partial [Candidatus Omnitrophica bacterium]|nr:type II secretion system protein GspK [Candidatus Omnitrophota bacterium]